MLRYSGALVEDARGRTIFAGLALRGRQLSLTVPGEWLAEADYPVVIDPLIGDPVLVSDPRAMQEKPALAYNPAAEEYLVVWAGYDSGGADPDLQGQRVAADGTLAGDLLVIAQAEGEQKFPAVVYNPDAAEYLVLWTDYRADPDGDVYGRRLAADGSPVGSHFPVGATEALQDTPDVAYNPVDELYLAVWRDRRGSAIYVYGQVIEANGALSGTNFAVYDGGGDNQQPRVAYSAANHEFLAVWSHWWSDIYGQRLSGTGALLDNADTPADESSSAKAFIINEAAHAQYYPAVAADTVGGYLVVWRDNRSDSSGDIYGQLITAGGELSGTDLVISAVPSFYQTYPEVTYDTGNGRYMAIWRHGQDIYGQLVTPGGALSGANFGVYAQSYTQTYPDVVANSTQGGYLAAWLDWRNYSANVYGRQVLGDGSTPAASFPIAPVTGVKQHPGLAFNGVSREYLLVWEDYRHGDGDIYGQRLNEAGEPVGGNVRISEATAGGDQTYPRVAAAGAEGYVVVWEDRRTDSGGDIYGQRVALDGSPAGGNFVVAATEAGQEDPVLAYNPAGGQYLAVWRDRRADGYGDIYGQFITAGGELSGSHRVISAYGPRTQRDPDVVFHRGTGQFMVVWTQWQSDNYDIYGQQVSGSGELLDNPGTPADETDPAVSFALTTQGADQEYARLALDETGGRYLAVWQDERAYAGSEFDIYGQLLTADGLPAGENLALSTAEERQLWPAVFAPGEGQGFLTVWGDARRGIWEVYGQRVSPGGELVGANELLVEKANYLSRWPALAGPPDYPAGVLVRESYGNLYAHRYSLPAADFEAAPRFGSAPLTVSFTNTSTPTTEISGYVWDFGDGITGTDVVPSHTYAQPGVYTVSLTAIGPGRPRYPDPDRLHQRGAAAPAGAVHQQSRPGERGRRCTDHLHPDRDQQRPGHGCPGGHHRCRPRRRQLPVRRELRRPGGQLDRGLVGKRRRDRQELRGLRLRRLSPTATMP